MKQITPQRFADAERFIHTHARLLERRLFMHLFRGEPVEPVVAALLPYRNADGGFGGALEPDIRDPGSQPPPIRAALELLDSIGSFSEEIALDACDFLDSVTTAEGGVPFVLPSAADYPTSPWMQAPPDPPAAVTFTAPIVGLLYKHGVEHPWRECAADYCRREVDAFNVDGLDLGSWNIPRVSRSYDAQALLLFLEHYADRPYAEAATERIGGMVVEGGLVDMDPNASGEAHSPWNYVHDPGSAMRRFFPDEVIEAHLNALIDAQKPDGGWMFNWPEWSPAATLDWRGVLTVDALRRLRAFGRL